MAKVTRTPPLQWIERELDDGRRVSLGFRRDKSGGRRTPVKLLLQDERGITSASLRDLPVGEIDRAANAPEVVAEASVLEHFASTPVRRPSTPEERDTLHVHVVMRLLHHLETTHRPAAVMAEESGVPVATVHRWIREARARGLLPPARRGAAG